MSYSKFGPGWKTETVAPPPPPRQQPRSEIESDADERSGTDGRFIVAFGIFVIIWVSSGAYAFYSGDSLTVDFINGLQHGDIIEVTQFLIKYFEESKKIVIAFLLLSITLLVVLIASIRWAAKALIYVTIILTSALLALFYGLIFYGIHRQRVRLYLLAPLTVMVVVYGIVIYTFKQTGIKAVSKIVRQACKAMFFFPSTFLLVTLQYLLQLVIVGYFATVYMYLNSIRLVRNESLMDFLASSGEFSGSNGTMNATAGSTTTASTTTTTSTTTASLDDFYEEYDIIEEFHRRTLVPYYVYPLHAVNALGLFWSLGFVAGIGRMALTATFAAWYQCADKKRLPLWTLPRNLFGILARHSGTIAYASSPASLVPMAIIVHENGRDRLREMLSRPFLVLSWLLILWRFSSDALAECAMHGKSFYKSAKDSYVLMMKHPMSLLTTNTISECMIFIASILVPFLTFLATLGYCYWRQEILQPVKVASVLTVTMASLIMSVTFFAVFRAASSTIHRCHLEDSKFSHEAEMNLYEIQVDDDMINDLET